MYNIIPGLRSGQMKIPASKSQAHRYIIAAGLSGRESDIICDGISEDIAATMACLKGLGAEFEGDLKIHCKPVTGQPAEECELQCGESGSTLRFMLPVAGALGAKGHFVMKGRLPERPMAPFDDELRKHGMKIRKEGNLLHFEGQLKAGAYTLPGSISSQYISGLLLALPLLDGNSILTITDKIESRDYIIMTEETLERAGIRFEKKGNVYEIPGRQKYNMPELTDVEGDFSNAAFFLSMGALSPLGITVKGLNNASKQGDRRIVDILKAFGANVVEGQSEVFVSRKELKGITIDAAMIPDLVPVLSVVAAAAEGESRIINAGRLRLKESDRIESTVNMINNLGGRALGTPDGLIIQGTGKMQSGFVDTCGDHRIAMSAAVAACISTGEVTVKDETCVNKSYPRFWDDFASLKGIENEQ